MISGKSSIRCCWKGRSGGIGQPKALVESCAYDHETGQLLSASLMDYTLTTCHYVFVKRSPTNPLGIKELEKRAIGAPPAIVNAVVNALTPQGVNMSTCHLLRIQSAPVRRIVSKKQIQTGARLSGRPFIALLLCISK